MSQKKESIEQPTHNRTIDENSDRENIISNTQSQQFKTVENTKMVFEEDPQTQSTKEVNLKKSLQQSYSQEEKNNNQNIPSSIEELKRDDNDDEQQQDAYDSNAFNQDVDAVDEVIEEKDEEEDEERKTGNPLKHRSRMPPQQVSNPSTMQGDNSIPGPPGPAGSAGNNSMGSQSRIRVTLTQEGQKLNIDEDQEEHNESPGLLAQQPRPTLTQGQFNTAQIDPNAGRPSIDSTPNPPIQEMVNME